MSNRESPAAIDDLAAEIIGTSGRLSAALCRWLLLIARLDHAEGCHRLGFASTASWLAYACGLSKRAASDHVRAAQALAAFPALVESMSAGRISYSHLRAISRVARAGEVRLVDDLIMVAEHGTVAHLEVVIRGLQTVEDSLRVDGGLAAEEYAALMDRTGPMAVIRSVGSAEGGRDRVRAESSRGGGGCE